MIKYYKLRSFIVCIMFIAALIGCNTMDTEPFESYSEDLVWNSKSTIDAFVLKSYNGTISNFAGGSAYWESLTPNGAQCDQVGNKINYVATETGIDVYSNYGFGRFSEQRKCNMIIEKAAASSSLSDKQKEEIIAEGHFLRGALYFDMTRKMGRFVPITKVLNIDDKEAFKTPLTASISESYKLVTDDLTKGAEGLPEVSKSGRANKYAAYALLSRAALQAYAYTKEKSYLDLVISSAKKVIDSGKYSLTDDYGSLFNNVSPNDKEIIFARYYLDKDATVSWFDEMIRIAPNIPSDDVRNGSADGINTLKSDIKTFDGWGEFWPTQDLVDQYLAIDESTGKAKLWYETSQVLDNVDWINPNNITTGSIEKFTRNDGEIRNIPTSRDVNTGRSDYPLFKHCAKIKDTSNKNITDLIYSNRDKRMDATIVRDKTTWLDEHVETNIGGNISQGIRSKENGGWYTTTTGYYWRKNVVKPDPRLNSSVKINMHFVISRLGEMYLNLAEAYLLKGETAKAIENLNVTRQKHGGLPAATVGTQEQAWKDYIRERRVEMAYENADIYYSYLRWGKYGGPSNYGRTESDIIKDLNAPIYKISITSNRKAICIGQLTVLDSWNRNFTRKRYLFPIPQGKIDTRTADGIVDEQNKGW